MATKKKKDINVPNLRFPGFEGKWEERKLACVADIYDGTHQTPQYVSEGVRFVSVEDISGNDVLPKYITEQAYEKGFKIKPQAGDILMTRITAGIIGATTIIRTSTPLAYYVSLALIRKKQEVTSEYLNYYINSTHFKHELHKRIIHVAFPKKINLGDIGQCRIAVTSLSEQKLLGQLLGLIDQRIDSQSKIIEKYESLIRSIREKMISKKMRFKDEKGNEFSDWKVKRLGDVALKKSSNISANKIEGNVGEFVIYGASGVLKRIDFYEEENDYISIVKDGAGVGRIMYCGAKSSVLGTMDIIKPKIALNTYFLYCLLGSIDFSKYVTGSTIPHIYFKDYSNESFAIPTIGEQLKIANFISRIEDKINIETSLLQKLENQKKYLLQEMFI